MKNSKVPRWYQALSIPQMDVVCTLDKIIELDQEEKITDRTQKALKDIGITSTYIRISSKDIKNLLIISNSDAAKFLCEIYRFITGNSFEEETYKKIYDCNERIVLSSIALLKLPETITELHRRLPMGKIHKIPPKPLPPKIVVKENSKSPYLQLPVNPPDWRAYRNELRKWEELRRSVVNPRAIIPSPRFTESKSIEPELKSHSPQIKEKKLTENKKRKRKKGEPQSNESSAVSSFVASTTFQINQSVSECLRTEGVNEEQIDDEIGGNTFEPDETYQDVDIYSNNIQKKTYPSGRENLSWKWQDWFLNVDESYLKLEKEANKILKNVREITNKIFNPDVCDDCCACGDIRKQNMAFKESKSPNLIIDNVIVDETGKRYIVGSLGIVSPPQTISDSSLTKPLIIPAEDEITKKTLIESVTLDEKGQPVYHASGFTKLIDRLPGRILAKPPLSRKNLPSCNCQAGDDLNNDDDEDDDSRMREENECTAKKYRKKEFNKYGKCGTCTDNKVFMEFERKMRDDERREEEKRKERIKKRERLPHKSRKNVREIIPVVEEVEEREKCEKCASSPEKCQPSPFKGILDGIINEKEAQRGNKKPSNKSGIKEYRENLKLAIGGVMRNDDDNNGAILTGVTMHTPITITPESSESEIIYPSMSQHHHWSVTEFVPKFSSKNIKSMKQHSVKKLDKYDDNYEAADVQVEPLFDDIKNVNIEPFTMKKEQKKVKPPKETQIMKKIVKPTELINIESERTMHGEDDGKMNEGKDGGNIKINLSKLMKETLKEMAKEGYLLAKLPHCYEMPPLQTWIMYRNGFQINEKIKKNRLDASLKAWESCEAHLYKNIKAPPINMSEKKKALLNYDQINRIKRKIASKKKFFYNNVRKSRVIQSRSMWNLMEYGRYPYINFKKSYFFYQVSKEADGYLIKPYGFEAT